ncbi:DUF6787 family protein [Balneola sp. MJW-20]|uniref:DUF6787 family protein n=1 Tax=Gracilimonas aurantiaca TaxID=3234185 RepID=UPI00346676B0
MNKLFHKLKERWGVDSFWKVLLILIIFAVTGMSALAVRKFAFEFLGYTDETSFWLKAITWIVVVFPSYQILFLFYGLLFGQFEFVWEFEKKSLSRLKKVFVRTGKSD